MVTFLRFFALGLFALACGHAYGQAAAPAAASSPDYSKEAFVIERDVTKFVFENDGTSTRDSTSRIRIQSDAGVQRYSVLTISYQSATESVDIDYVRVIKPDGTVISTPLDQVQDMPAEVTRQAPFYSDLHEKQIAVKGLSSSDVLEFHERWRTTKPLIPGQFWQAYNFSKDVIGLHEELQVSVPRTRPLKWKSPEVKPVITEEGDRRIFTWIRSQLSRQSADDEKKDNEEKLYQLTRGKLSPPDVQLSTFQSWEEIGNWYNSLQLDRVKPNDEIRAKAMALTKDATDDNAKLHAIYNYVSTQFHYIGIAFGIGRYQPHAASEVLANQYGDCKDKHTLLASLLAAAGIPAYPALIGSSHELDPDVPSPAQFDHVITAVPQGKEFLWLDTTSEVAPFRYLMSPLWDKHALVIPSDKPPLLVATPTSPPSHGVDHFSIHAKLSDSGILDGRIERQVSGTDIEVILRMAFRRVPLPQWKDLVQQISYGSGFAGEVSEVTASSPEKMEEPFRFSYNYNRKDFPDWSNRRIACAVPPFGLPVVDTKPSHPILLGVSQEIHYESHVELPKGYSPQLPGNVDLKEDFAEYHASYSAKDGVLTVDRHLTVKMREVPPSAYDAYKKFSKAVANDYELYVNLASAGSARNPRQLVMNLPDSDNEQAMQAYNDAMGQARSNNSSDMIASLNRAVDADPKFVRAWLLLSQLYAATGKQDLAMETLRKANNANPGQSPIYQALVGGLMGSGKSDEAMAILQERVKAAPPDAETLSFLASALSSLKRYDEAAAALETAIKLKPDDSSFHARLGFNYLKANLDSKSEQAFKEALALDSRPFGYNDVAFWMADANKNLPLALEYAQKAVREEEEASAKVQLSDLKVEDLGHTNNLAAYWDTLGWVYFRMGNLEQAEKYLNAAWTLSQNGEVADHLGQVYENQHKKEAALHMYRLALSASPTVTGVGVFMTDLRAKIKQLGGVDTPLVKEADELSRLRTVKLARVVPGQANAEFFVQIDPGPRIRDIKFISGSEELRSAGKNLTSADLKVQFPDEGPASLVRRGILACYSSTGCSFVLLNPSDVRSVN